MKKEQGCRGWWTPIKVKGCRGWSNYETWAVNLWIENNEELYRYKERLAKSARDAYVFARDLSDWIEGTMPDLGATLAGDLLSASLREVNWLEIAKAWMEDKDS